MPSSNTGARVAIVHDYLTQRGGAERIVLSLAKAFPGAPLHTSLFDVAATFPEFASLPVQTLPLNRVAALRRNYRWALPVLAPAFSRYEVDADVVLCSSSGWAHGVGATGARVVYCYTPARWLYQTQRYARGQALTRMAAAVFRRPLVAWDRRRAENAARYVTQSSAVQQRIRDLYGIEAEVVPGPPALTPGGPQRAVAGIEEGFTLCVSRLLPYKNVDAVVDAFAELRDERLVVVGDGPERARLQAQAPSNVRFVGSVSDEELRWLYASSRTLVSASYEDYGLTPLEAAGFGRPAAVLRWGGFLDTVVEGETGEFFEDPAPRAIADAIRRLHRGSYPPERLRSQAARFGEDRFVARIRAIVADVHAAQDTARQAVPNGCERGRPRWARPAP